MSSKLVFIRRFYHDYLLYKNPRLKIKSGTIFIPRYHPNYCAFATTCLLLTELSENDYFNVRRFRSGMSNQTPRIDLHHPPTLYITIFSLFPS